MGYVLPWGQMSLLGRDGHHQPVLGASRSSAPTITDLAAGAGSRSTTRRSTASSRCTTSCRSSSPAWSSLHIWACTSTGNNNPTGRCGTSKAEAEDTVPFQPYYTIKDLFATGRRSWCSSRGSSFFMPNFLGHPGQLHPGQPAEDPGAHRAGMVLPAVLRDPAALASRIKLDAACIAHVRLDRASCCSCPGSTPRASARRPTGRSTASSSGSSSLSIGLGYLGSQPPEGWLRRHRRASSTAYCFAHFLIILPLLGLIEKPKPMPKSITEAVLSPSEPARLRAEAVR